MVQRFQVKLTGSEILEMKETGRIVGWKIEFFSCQPAAVKLIVNELPVDIDEGLFIPASSQLRLKFDGDKAATAGVSLVLEKVL